MKKNLSEKLLELDHKFDYYGFSTTEEVERKNEDDVVRNMYRQLYEDPEKYAEDIKAFDEVLRDNGYTGMEKHEFLYKLVNIEKGYDYYNFRDAFDYMFDAMCYAGDDIPFAIRVMRETYEDDIDNGPEALNELETLLKEYGYQEN